MIIHFFVVSARRNVDIVDHHYTDYPVWVKLDLSAMRRLGADRMISSLGVTFA